MTRLPDAARGCWGEQPVSGGCGGGRGGPARSHIRVSATPPCRRHSQSPACPSRGPCLYSGVSWLFYLYSCHLQPKQRNRKHKLHGGQVHAGCRAPSSAPARPYKKWKRHGAACRQVLLTGVSLPASQGDPPNGETAQAGQTLLLPLLWDPSD